MKQKLIFFGGLLTGLVITQIANFTEFAYAHNTKSVEHEWHFNDQKMCPNEIRNEISSFETYSDWKKFRPKMIEIQMCQLQLIAEMHKAQHDLIVKQGR